MPINIVKLNNAKLTNANPITHPALYATANASVIFFYAQYAHL